MLLTISEAVAVKAMTITDSLANGKKFQLIYFTHHTPELRMNTKGRISHSKRP